MGGYNGKDPTCVLFKHRISRLMYRQVSAKNQLKMPTHIFAKFVADICKKTLFVLVDPELLFKSTKVVFRTNRNIIEGERPSAQFGFLAS